MKTLTRYRLLLGLAVLMMFTPTFLYFAGPLRDPLTFDGDRFVELKSRQVDGRLQLVEDDQDTEYEYNQFIIPGPNRPARITGTVYAEPDPNKRVAAAQVRLLAGDLTLELETSPEGQFGLDLPPGTYTLEIAAFGYAPHSQELVVDYSQEPIPAEPVEQAWRFVELSVGLEPASRD